MALARLLLTSGEIHGFAIRPQVAMAIRGSMDETVQRPMDRSVDQPPPSAQLRLIFPRPLFEVIRLGSADLVIGRQSGACDHKIDDPTVSRSHFAISWDSQSQQHLGRDLGSRNGCRIEGENQLAEDAPVPLRDQTLIRLGDVLLVYEIGAAVDAVDGSEVSVDAIPGSAASTRQLRGAIASAAPDPSPILLVGETGTGKEFIAREIHRLSNRQGPLLAINCAALSPQLIESQLFGHARGAFTGADSAHEGMFRAANGGTLFLDEIGELPRDLQAKLLRVLQEREVQPVGETRPVKVDVRVVSATLRDLTTMTEEDAFRLDLYARLSPWEIRVPALRERRADLLDWIERLHRRWHERRTGRGAEVEPPRFEANGVERLLLCDWADNLRGVDRLVHRSCTETVAGPIDLPAVGSSSGSYTGPGRPSDRGSPPARASSPTATALQPDKAQAEPVSETRPEALQANPAATKKTRARRRPRPPKEELVVALQQNSGSVRATAKHFGRDRRQIYRWMAHYGLREED